MTYKSKIRDLVKFALLGALLLIGKIVFEPLPNVHPLGALVMVYTITYRTKALIPIYLYVFLQGLLSGFNLWWLPYTYIWTVLWGMTMLLPDMKKKRCAIVYPLICGLHGLMFGILYAPAQAIIFSLDFNMMIKWIIAGLPYDLIHCAGNFAAGFLVLPLVSALMSERRQSL